MKRSGRSSLEEPDPARAQKLSFLAADNLLKS